MAKKHTKIKRMPKSNKRMKRHFDDGGGVDMSTLSMPQNITPDYDSLSFGKAYQLAKQLGDKVFTYKGQQYAADPTLEAKNKAALAARAARSAPSQPYTEDFSDYLKTRITPAQARAAANQNEWDAAKFLGGTAAAGAGLGLGAAALGAPALEAMGFGGSEGAADVAGAGRIANLDRGAGMMDKWRKGRDFAERMWKNRQGAQAAESAETAPSPNQAAIDSFIKQMQAKQRLSTGSVYKKGGKIKSEKPVVKMARGGHVSSASSRADGIASRGKTRCKY
jgi:hypothetical protein